MKMQGKQKAGNKFRKLGPKNVDDRRKFVNLEWLGTPPSKPTSVDSKHRRIPKTDSGGIQKMKRVAEPTKKKEGGKDVQFRPPILSKRQLIQMKTETRKKIPGDGLHALRQNIIGDWDRGRKPSGGESGRGAKPKPKLVGFDNLSSTKCSFRVALIQNGGRRFGHLPKITEEEKLLNKNSASASNFFVLQTTQQTYNKTRTNADLKQLDCFKPEFDAITQNDKKIEVLEAKLRKLSLEGENKEAKPQADADGSLEKGINDIQISLSELNGILKKIQSSKTCAQHQENEEGEEKEDKDSKDVTRSTAELTNLVEKEDIFEERFDELKSTDSVTSNESMQSLKVNVHSETCNDFSDCTQLEKPAESVLLGPTAVEDSIAEKRISSWDEAHWKMLQRKDNFETKLSSQVALMVQKEDAISKLQGKLREMTEDLQNTCQERMDFAFQSKRLFHVYEDKLHELYKCCKLAEEEMHFLRKGREKLVDTLREQVGVQADLDGIFEAYQHVLREKEAMEVEMRNLFGFLIEQGKSMDNLRGTVKTMTEQLESMRQEFQQQNDSLSAYYEGNFKELNSNCEELQRQLRRQQRPASLTLLSECEIETFSCRSISPPPTI